MAKFVTKPNHKSLKYYIFSTVVMAPVTRKMYRKEMIAWLEANGMEYWLDESESHEDRVYWNGDFAYVTEEDGYYVG